MWLLSLLFSLTGSAANLFFSLRYPSVAITPIIALVLVHPLGKFWDVAFKRTGDPSEVFENGSLLHRESQSDEIETTPLPLMSRARLWFGQGRWNEKEHACVYISSNVSFGFAFATDVSANVATTFPLTLNSNPESRSSWSSTNFTSRTFRLYTSFCSSYLPKSWDMHLRDLLEDFSYGHRL